MLMQSTRPGSTACQQRLIYTAESTAACSPEKVELMSSGVGTGPVKSNSDGRRASSGVQTM